MMPAFKSHIASAPHIGTFLIKKSFMVFTNWSVTQNALTKAGKMLRVIRSITPGHPRSEVEVGGRNHLSSLSIFQHEEVMPSVQGFGEQLTPFIEGFLDLAFMDLIECNTHRPITIGYTGELCHKIVDNSVERPISFEGTAAK